MARDPVQKRLFGDRLDERAHVIATLERHNAAVQAAITPERPLVYEVSQGWEPLCRFLGVAVPDTLVPRINAREELLAA